MDAADPVERLAHEPAELEHRRFLQIHEVFQMDGAAEGHLVFRRRDRDTVGFYLDHEAFFDFG